MSNNSQILKAFNDHFFEFIDDILKVFPDDTDLEATKLAFVNFRKMNPKLIIISFKTYVVDKYRTEIQNGDLNFFINKNYSEDVGNNKNNELILKKIDVLREPIRQMGKENQDKSFKYISNLSKLCDLYN
tara:strand:+ start:2233 stop:2622 length:390 start_codon:yes stop_codon:yes gene_type:complete